MTATGQTLQILGEICCRVLAGLWCGAGPQGFQYVWIVGSGLQLGIKDGLHDKCCGGGYAACTGPAWSRRLAVLFSWEYRYRYTVVIVQGFTGQIVADGRWSPQVMGWRRGPRAAARTGGGRCTSAPQQHGTTMHCGLTRRALIARTSQAARAEAPDELQRQKNS